MSTAESTGLMTAEEFYDFCHRPENRDRRFELERGEVVEMSRPGEQHGYVCGNFTRILGNYTFQRRKGMSVATTPASFGNAAQILSKARTWFSMTRIVAMVSWLRNIPTGRRA